MITAKHYDLRVNGQIVRDLAEAEIAELFRTGRVSQSTPCRLYGKTEWQNVNEYLPLLKYGVPERKEPAYAKNHPRRAGEAGISGKPQWRVGVSCFAAGLLCAGAVNVVPMDGIFPQASQPRSSRVVRAVPLNPLPASLDATAQAQSTPGQGGVVNASLQRTEPASGSSTLSVQGSASTGSAIDSTVTATPPLRPEEATISLGKWTTVKSPYGFFRIKVRDDGPRAISVWVDQADEPKRVEKVKGFESTGSNIVQIHSIPGAKVYYVDRLRVPLGCCVLKVIPET